MNIDNYINKLNLTIKTRNKNFINIRCPICGDSHINNYKARGYILLDKETPIYHCHNCGANMNFYSFLKHQDSKLANDYYRETKIDYIKKDPTIIKKPKYQQEDINIHVKEFNKMIYKFDDKEQIYDLVPLSDKALLYLYNRGFKDEMISDFKYCQETDDIVIPYWYNKNKNLVYGIQSRNIEEKRFHLNFFENKKVGNYYIKNKLSIGDEIYIFESELDRISTGIFNSMSSLSTSLSKDIYLELKDKYKLIFCFDADEAGDKSIFKYAKKGHSVLVHQKEMYNFKDFNQLLMLGQPKEEIEKYIKENIKPSKIAIIELMSRGIR